MYDNLTKTLENSLFKIIIQEPVCQTWGNFKTRRDAQKEKCQYTKVKMVNDTV